MKIAHFIPTFRKEDGVSRVIINLVKEAKKRGIESVIVTGWIEDASISPVPIITIPALIFPLYKDYRIPLPGMRGFEKQLNEFKPDYIHVHTPETSGFAALKYAKKYHVTIFSTYHTDFPSYLPYYHLKFLEPLLWKLLRKFYNQVDFVTTPSWVISKELEDHGIKNVKTVPWGVDPNHFNPTFRSEEWRKKINGNQNKIIILSACRLVWEKDLRVLAAIYNLLKQKRNDFSMVIAGEGPAKKELETLMPGAIFLGHLENEELSKTFASSDILLFPSITDTFGQIIVEAMASRITPVVADARGPKSLVINGENGFLCQPHQVTDFFSKVCQLLDNPELLDKIRTVALAEAKNYSWEHEFGKILELATSSLSKQNKIL